jgi:hypothetical protein
MFNNKTTPAAAAAAARRDVSQGKSQASQIQRAPTLIREPYVATHIAETKKKKNEAASS